MQHVFFLPHCSESAEFRCNYVVNFYINQVIIHKIYFFDALKKCLCAYFTAKIQGMKNAVPKNDKKRRKQLTEEIAKLETDLNQKHEEELKQLKSTADTKVTTFIQID